jgi:hypothetical protein
MPNFKSASAIYFTIVNYPDMSLCVSFLTSHVENRFNAVNEAVIELNVEKKKIYLTVQGNF